MSGQSASTAARGEGRAELADARFMRRALELAARGLATTDPNPRVGCVIVRDGRIVAEGWHERAGGPHAETRALALAGERAAGATAYVTLEPCSHYGRTPPCAEALIGARLARVVFALEDPNPLVRGRGAAALHAAGIEVSAGLLAEEARQLNPGYVRRMAGGLPWVRVKLAASLDGRTALASGESRWITGEAARLDVQRFRARSSAILTASGTVLADDPQLTVRLEGTQRQPLRVVLDSQLRVPPSARVYGSEGQTLVFTASREQQRVRELEQRGVRVENAAPGGARPDYPAVGLALEPVLRRLAELELNELWVEAGPTLSGALLASGLVDELIVYLAPCLLGAQARALAGLPGIERLEQRLRLEFTGLMRIGEDLRLCARVRRAPASEGDRVGN